MTDLDLSYASANSIAKQIRDKQLSPVDVVKNVFERISEVQPQLNPFCFTYFEAAMEAAKRAEHQVLTSKPLGLLHGVPFALKDFTPTQGKVTTRGSYALKDWVPDYNSIILERLQNAGAILIGKTTSSEFAFSSFTETNLWGTTRNPWDKERTPGGSSGGSAVAVATGCVPFAEGTDMGGSVRIPAAFCGTVGLKPSLGRIPMDILPTVFDSTAHFGPLARTVGDALLFLKATQGPDDRDIQSISPGLDIPPKLPDNLRGLRLAFSPNLGFYAVDKEIEKNTQDAINALRARGAIVEEVEINWTREVVDAWSDYWSVFQAATAGQHLNEYRAQMNPELVKLIEYGRSISAVDFKQLEFVRTKQWNELARWFKHYDALICPTTALPAPPVGMTDTDFDSNNSNGLYQGLDMTCLFNNIPQCPSLSVPSGFTKDGLPTAVQIVGRRFDELTTLRVGLALEAELPWAGQRPVL